MRCWGRICYHRRNSSKPRCRSYKKSSISHWRRYLTKNTREGAGILTMLCWAHGNPHFCCKINIFQPNRKCSSRRDRGRRYLLRYWKLCGKDKCMIFCWYLEQTLRSDIRCTLRQYISNNKDRRCCKPRTEWSWKNGWQDIARSIPSWFCTPKYHSRSVLIPPSCCRWTETSCSLWESSSSRRTYRWRTSRENSAPILTTQRSCCLFRSCRSYFTRSTFRSEYNWRTWPYCSLRLWHVQPAERWF